MWYRRDTLKFVRAIQFFIKNNTKHADILSEDLNTFLHTYQGQIAKFIGMADEKVFLIISAGKYEAQTPLMFKITF